MSRFGSKPVAKRGGNFKKGPGLVNLGSVSVAGTTEKEQPGIKEDLKESNIKVWVNVNLNPKLGEEVTLKNGDRILVHFKELVDKEGRPITKRDGSATKFVGSAALQPSED